MELDNVDVLLGMTIGCIILGIGLSLFFTQSYTGYGAVVMAIGMMTLSLMITARPRVIERVKRENMLQPIKRTAPELTISPPANVLMPKLNEPAPTAEKKQEAPSQINDEAQPIESARSTEPESPQTQESATEQKAEPVPVAPS